MNQALPLAADYIRVLPEIVLSLFGMAIMVIDPLVDEEKSQRLLGGLGLGGTVAALIATWIMAQSPGFAFWSMVRVNGFSVFFHVLVIVIALVVILTSYEYMAVQKLRAGEYYALILFGLVGMCLMSSAPKAAAFAVLLRILFEANAPGRFWFIWVSAALSMTLGNVAALVQHNVKRLLAYSPIAHAGYIMVAFAARPELGAPAV